MDVGEYYSKSFNDFKENLSIAIPSLVGIILTFVIMIIAGLVVSFGFLGLQSFNGIVAPDYVSSVSFTAVLISVLIIIIAVVISLIINSFVYAATIGMAKKILEGEKPGLEVAWKSGKKYFINILAVSIIMGLIGIVLTIPLLLGLILFSVSYILGAVISVLGILILIVGFILLVLAFFVVNQSIVIGRKSIIGSIKASIKVLMENKLQVFLVAIINLAIAIGINFFLGVIPFIGSFLNVLAGIILTPYFILVVTYLYMDVKGRLPKSEP